VTNWVTELGGNVARLEGNRIYFDQAETQAIADGANIVGMIAVVIHVPIASHTISAVAKGSAFWARSAVRRGKCLGLFLLPGFVVVRRLHPAVKVGALALAPLILQGMMLGKAAFTCPVPFEYRP
jgi:hypothetical protein